MEGWTKDAADCMNSLSHSKAFFANVSIMSLRLRIRSLSLKILPIFLLLVVIAILALQFTELSAANEIFSLSSFIILISFSALAFNWCRAPTTFTSETQLHRIYQVGIDCFIASLLALVSTFFTWAQISPFFKGTMISQILFGLHWIFLLLALGLFLLSLLELLKTTSDLSRRDNE